MCEFWYTAKTLDDSKIWVSTPTGGIRGNIGYSGEIGAKGTLKKSFLPPSKEVDYAKLIWEDIIHKLNKKIREKVVPYPRCACELQSSKTFLKSKEVPQGKNPGAKSGLRRKQSSKHTFESKTEASKSKTGQSEKETQSSSAKDNSLSHHSPPTPVGPPVKKEPTLSLVVVCMHLILIEPVYSTSFHLHSESASGHDASVDSTAEADLENSAPNDFIPAQQDLLKDTRYAFFTPDSLQDEPIIVSDESEEEEVEKDDTHATSHDVPEDTSIPHPPSLKSVQIQELMAQLKKHVQDMEIELPGDLKEIPTKLETFTSTISSLSSQVVELKNIQWELPAEFQALPSQVSLVHEKLKTLDSLPILLNKVTDTLNRFATMVENALGAAHNNVPSAGQASASPAEGEKHTTKDAETNPQNEVLDLLVIDMVEQYHNKKLLFDKYCDKMLKRRKSSKIINCDVLAQKGHISLKVYREDGTIEIIANSNSVTYIWLNGERMEYLDQTEKELKIDFNKPLKEQDPLNELNDLANKKRKRTGDSRDHSRSTKKHKSSVQHEEEKIGKYLHFSLCSGTKTEEGLWKELQFSLVVNSMLNIVYLLNIRLKRLFHFLKVYKAGKRLLYVKRNKAISLGK
ncbi:hypothetical protein Tco_0500881 [Tanacetum coccineum]